MEIEERKLIETLVLTPKACVYPNKRKLCEISNRESTDKNG